MTDKYKPRRVTEADIAIGERIRKRRKKLKMSQADLGKPLGISFQQVQKYERGHNRVPASRLVEITKILQVNVLCLLLNIDDHFSRALDATVAELVDD